MTVTTDKKTEASDEDLDAEETETEVTDAATEETETDAATEADGATEDEAVDPANWRPQQSRRGRILAALLAAVLIALVGLSGFLGWKLWQDHRLTQAGQQAQASAVAYAQVLTSVDTDKVDQNFDEVLAGATGEFKDVYTQASVQLRQLLIDNKAAAHGVVMESAVQSASADKVVVLLFVDQSVSNMKLPDPRIDRSRIKMTMEKVDGRWLASKVELP